MYSAKGKAVPMAEYFSYITDMYIFLSAPKQEYFSTRHLEGISNVLIKIFSRSALLYNASKTSI